MTGYLRRGYNKYLGERCFRELENSLKMNRIDPENIAKRLLEKYKRNGAANIIVVAEHAETPGN